MERFNSDCPFLLESVVSQCAEVADKAIAMLRRNWLEEKLKKGFVSDDQKTVVIRQRRIRIGTKLKKTGYTCPACESNNIRLCYSFCPLCGIKIKWELPSRLAYYITNEVTTAKKKEDGF